MEDVMPLEIENYDFIDQVKNTYEVTLPAINFNNLIFGRIMEAEEIFDILSRNKVLVVVNGIGGIRKTTLCKYLYRNVRKIAEQEYDHTAMWQSCTYNRTCCKNNKFK